jgi:hypothetical protein
VDEGHSSTESYPPQVEEGLQFTKDEERTIIKSGKLQDIIEHFTTNSAGGYSKFLTFTLLREIGYLSSCSDPPSLLSNVAARPRTSTCVQQSKNKNRSREGTNPNEVQFLLPYPKPLRVVNIVRMLMKNYAETLKQDTTLRKQIGSFVADITKVKRPRETSYDCSGDP